MFKSQGLIYWKHKVPVLLRQKGQLYVKKKSVFTPNLKMVIRERDVI